MCKDKGTPNFRQIEVEITASQQQYSLKEEEILSDCKKIIGVEVYKVANVSVSPTGRPLVNNTVFTKSYLVIATKDSDEVLYMIPLASMDRSTNQGEIFRVDIPPIAPSKCYIKVGSIAGIVAGESFLLGFHYER